MSSVVTMPSSRSIASRSAPLATMTARRKGLAVLHLAWERAARPSSIARAPPRRRLELRDRRARRRARGSRSGGPSRAARRRPPPRPADEVGVDLVREEGDERRQQRRHRRAGSGAGSRTRRGRPPRSAAGTAARTSWRARRRSRRSSAPPSCSRRRPCARSPSRDHPLQARERPPVEVRALAGLDLARSRTDPSPSAFAYRTQNEYVFQSVSKNWRTASPTCLGGEPVARPRLLGGEVVPAERVGAVEVDHLPRVDDVAAALRHLLAVGVEDQPEADAVAVAGLVEEQGRDREQRVEPAAGLVDAPR